LDRDRGRQRGLQGRGHLFHLPLHRDGVPLVGPVHPDRHRSYFVGDDPAVSIRVDRSNKGDAIAIQGQVEEVAAELEATLPPDVTVELIRTR
ncbi:MAG: hypothetical protein AAFQ60_18345, partial [Pseudomonadota bacterium]